MPQVPTYDNPTVGIAPVATLQATPLGPDAFGAGLAGGLHEISKALDIMATHNDHAQVMAARNDLNQRMQDLAYNQEIDPDTGQPMGYLLRQGQAADSLEQEFRGDLQENLDDIKSGLQNDVQRAAFDQIAAKHINEYSTAINEHEYKQKMAYNGELTKASVDLSLNGIAQDFQFPDLVSSHIDDGVTAIKSQAALNGISPDSPVLQDQLTQYESSAHKTVIDSLIKTGQATTAMKYFDEFDKGEAATDDQGNAIRDHLKGQQELWQSIDNYKSSLEPLIKSAKESKNEHKTSKIGNVQDWLAKEASSNGVNIDGYQHSIDTSAIRHILNRHGDVVSERKRGLVAVTHEDIASIPEIIATPDKVVFGAKNKRNQDLIVYLKTMPDGSTIYIEEVRGGKKELATASMRKYPATSRAESILSTLDSTAKTDGGNNFRIVEAPENVKSLFQTVAGRLSADGARDFNSKTSDVNTFLQSAVNHLAADGVKELYQSDKPLALWAKLKAPRLPGSEARGAAEPSEGDISSALNQFLEDVGKKKKQFPAPELLPSTQVKAVGEALASTDKTILNQNVGNVKGDLPDDKDALLAILQNLLFPKSEAQGAEPSTGNISSTPNTDEHDNNKVTDIDRKEATTSTTPPISNDRVKKVVTGVLHSAITRIKTPSDAAHIAFPLTKRAQEAAIAIVTDAKGNVLGVIQHSTGGLNSTTMSPRDLLGVIHDFPGAAEVWFAHNHPTGDPTMSPEDWEMTSRLAALLDGSGIKSRGMIIVGHEGGAAWTEGKGGRNKDMPLGSLKTDKERTKKIETYDREIIKLSPSEHLTDPSQEVENAGSPGADASGIIILDAKNRPISFVHMSLDEMAKLKTGDPATGSSAIMSAFHKANGWGMIMFAPVIPDHHAAVQNMVSFGNMFGGKLLDVLESESGRSFALAGLMPKASDHFFQGGDVKRGYIRFDNNRNFEIGLLKDANLSTFIHESGHFFTEVLGDLAERPDAPQQIKDDYAALLKFVGVDSRDAIRTEHHEQLAQAFEKYIMEGNAPSVELHGMFQRMKAWMIGVYKDIRRHRRRRSHPGQVGEHHSEQCRPIPVGDHHQTARTDPWGPKGANERSRRHGSFIGKHRSHRVEGRGSGKAWLSGPGKTGRVRREDNAPHRAV
jgi:hypothetical protein